MASSNFGWWAYLRANIRRTVKTWQDGIRNESSIIIDNVRVVLESFTWRSSEGDLVGMPTPQHPVLVEHALNVMGSDKKHGRVSVAPGDRPTAFVDVVAQKRDLNGPASRHMTPCYASRHTTRVPTTPGVWLFGLRVEGGGTFNRASFTVTTNANGVIVMAPYSLS